MSEDQTMEDIYKTPQAELLVGNPAGTDFYVVAKSKFLLLFLLTCSLYAYYWFYKNWQLQKLKTGESIMPVWRSIFAIFFVHTLFGRVDFNRDVLGISTIWHPNLLAGSYILVILLSAISDRLSVYSIGTPFTNFMFIPFLLLECYILFRAQVMINLVSGDAKGDQNRRFTPFNIICTLIGSVFWVFIAAGLATILFPGLIE